MNLFEEAQKFMATRQKPIAPEQSFLSTTESKESFIRELKIIYDGSWFSKSGHSSSPQENTGNGTKVIKLDCVAWDTVSVYVEKSEDSTQNMKVQLLRNGVVVAENSTTSGQISFTYSN